METNFIVSVMSQDNVKYFKEIKSEVNWILYISMVTRTFIPVTFVISYWCLVSLMLFQVDTVISFHIGEIITSLQRATLIPGGSESLVYTTLSGGIGMLVPFTSHEV